MSKPPWPPPVEDQLPPVAELSPDDTRLSTGGVDGMARIWEVKTGQELLSVQAHPDGMGITRLAFSPDGKNFIAPGAGYLFGCGFNLDETIRLAYSRLTRRFGLG